MANNDLLSKIIFEAKSYNTVEDIETLVDVGADLSMIPIQPLYMSLISSNTDQVANILPKLSSSQRQVMLDLDLWKKDVVDVESFEFWIESYSKIEDLKLVQSFVNSEDFLLYLKSRVNVYTFDVEDPQYPDHDFYFLTDDSLLLIEYSEEFKYPNELKYMIRNLYDLLGVDQAYSKLFKLINDSFAVLQEELYINKRERLRDYGFVDYYEAIEKINAFISYKQVESFILSKKRSTPNIDRHARNQSLHGAALVSFDTEMENLIKELNKVTDEKRLNFLHFTFIRMINSTIVIHDALKGGRVELTRIGKVTKSYLELGLQKVRDVKQYTETESVFVDFDFFDLYRIGKSLIEIEKNKIKKSLRKTPFENDDYEYFLGAWWTSFLEYADSEIPKMKSFGAGLHAQKISSLSTYQNWTTEVDLFRNSIPFINSFFEMFLNLKKEGKLHDSFYLNYEVENIDFEAILISSFINFSLGHFSGSDVNKMGVTISELKQFFNKFFTKNDEEYILLPLTTDFVLKTVDEFIKKFGFKTIPAFEKYLYGVLSEHLSGYEFDTLDDEDFKHIGGPILLNFTKN